ncbi:hypothetical protein G6F57_006694 [Rhizopus arrhizus]|uniref:Integrase zinc-binding domain-containing protein n=1 Tax=Rhizopus oryzae TaxID=64495 RepID=A0A9P7BU00_RHIOR|nr:hypothetical protein G6F23_003009 [Rhizopus arrhizus]KAG1413232.1 hypothetical protein G6F58_007603 [Rhizopus delemar]KAG0763047.1 hypothetical protein G6F24_006324 [Rhizopus arrhizus]KAG0782446.1 hypothetical protein G6F22_009103 [Rhizopus arrhizus]KAG0792583.1 hypothetical protein G6F21_004250 [Rhizopus arrhizus]
MQPYIPSYSNFFFPSQTHAILRRATYPSEEEVYGVPSKGEFDAVVEDYLSRLSLKKRDKALIDQGRYIMIREVLKNPKDTSVSTAQFRFWPVATKEDIYAILVAAHREANHGGRDKTSAIVKYQFSWIPKELIARFVRCCPTCKIRRNGCNFTNDSSPSPPPVHFNYEAIYGTAKSAAAAAVASSNFYSSTPTILSSTAGLESIESTPSPAEPQSAYYSFPSKQQPMFGPGGIFEEQIHEDTSKSPVMYPSSNNNYYDYAKENNRHEGTTYLDDMLSTYKLSIGPELLNPNDILESIMNGWTQQENEKDTLSYGPQEQSNNLQNL